MIAVTARTRVFVCIAAVDFRNGIDGLARVCRELLAADPFSGANFQAHAATLDLILSGSCRHWICRVMPPPARGTDRIFAGSCRHADLLFAGPCRQAAG